MTILNEYINYFYPLWDYFIIIIQIAILFFVIYPLLYFIRGTRAANVLAGIIVILLFLTVATEIMKLVVLAELLNGIWTVFPIALVVIFQPELRRAFAQFGSNNPFSKKQRQEETISEVVSAALNLSASKTGAIIVFQRQIGMRAIISSGTKIDAKVNSKLIETIFNKNTPLHDGGIVIENDRIIAAHCIFPLSQNPEILSSTGTRHRAAIGITEETDAVAVVVSEETARISIAAKGAIITNLSGEKLARILKIILFSRSESFIDNITKNAEDEVAFDKS